MNLKKTAIHILPLDDQIAEVRLKKNGILHKNPKSCKALKLEQPSSKN